MKQQERTGALAQQALTKVINMVEMANEVSTVNCEAIGYAFKGRDLA